MKRWAAWCVVIACGGAAQSTTTETPSNDGSPWKELAIAWDFGPCADDGRSCHQVLTIDYAGGFIAAETPNVHGATPAEPVRRFSALDSQEIRELHRIATGDFVSKLGSFPCTPESDATIRIDIDGHKQEIGGCVHAPSANAPRALIELVEHHRWASHDAKSTHEKPPSGAGDPCNVATGCGAGLMCVASPCVVAPCTSGSCQPTQ